MIVCGVIEGPPYGVCRCGLACLPGGICPGADCTYDPMDEIFYEPDYQQYEEDETNE